MGTSIPDAYCVVLGGTNADPLVYVGPFDSLQAAEAHVLEHQQKNPTVAAVPAVLVNPANCP